MNTATPAQQNLAWRLLTVDLNDRQDSEALSEAAERACQQLNRRLAELVTIVGSRLLWARALHLARAEFPFLAGVQAGPTGQPCLEGLSESVRGVPSAQTRAGLVAVLANLLGLLTTFIGEDLTLRLLRDIWPDAPLEQPGSVQRETQT